MTFIELANLCCGSYEVGESPCPLVTRTVRRRNKSVVGRPRENIGPMHRISRNLVEMFLMRVHTQPEA